MLWFNIFLNFLWLIGQLLLFGGRHTGSWRSEMPKLAARIMNVTPVHRRMISGVDCIGTWHHPQPDERLIFQASNQVMTGFMNALRRDGWGKATSKPPQSLMMLNNYIHLGYCQILHNHWSVFDCIGILVRSWIKDRLELMKTIFVFEMDA